MLGFLIILSINYFANIISDSLSLPIPGTILALILLFILLTTKALKYSLIDGAANFLLANLVIMLIPPTVKLIEQIPTIKETLPQIIIILVLSTIITMIVTAFAVKCTLLLMQKFQKGGDQ